MAIRTKTNDMSLSEQSSIETEINDAVRVYLVKSGMNGDDAQAMSNTIVSQTDSDCSTNSRDKKAAALNAAIDSVRVFPEQCSIVPEAIPPSRPRSMRPATPYKVTRVLSPKAWLPLPGRIRVLARSQA